MDFVSNNDIDVLQKKNAKQTFTTNKKIISIN